MYCVRSSEELTCLLDRELSPERAAELKQHVAGCAACRRELSQLKQASKLVGALAEVAPPADLRARVERKVAQVRSAPALTCSGACEMLDEYAHGELAREAASRVCAHLSECESCSRELARLEECAGLVGALAEVGPPPGIRQRVQAEVARRSRPLLARPTFRGMIATLGTAVAAAAVMLAMHLPTATQPPAAVSHPRPPSEPGNVAGAPAPSLPRPVTSEAAARASERPAASGEAAAAAAATVTGRPAASPAPAVVRLRLRHRAPAAATVAERGAASTADLATATAEMVAQLPAATPALPVSVAYAGPAVEPEPEVATEALPRPHPARDAVQASAAPTMASPLSEVRRLLRAEEPTEPTTVRPRRQPDRLASGPISPWGF